MEVDVSGAHSLRVPDSIMHGISSSCSRGSKLRFLLLITQITWAMSERNTEIILQATPGGAWNKTLQKEILHCSNFHMENISDYFYLWPEDKFEHCCQSNFNGGGNESESLGDYRYSMYGSHLSTAVYYDLGPIDMCLPYWSCRDLIEKYEDVATFDITCEKNDVMRLNTYRFWILVVLRYGLAETALPLIVSLQLLTCAAIGARHRYCRLKRRRAPRASDKTPLPTLEKGSEIFKEYWNDEAIWKSLCMDFVHLVLLSIIGNGLVEAVGRQDPGSWQSKLFYRFSKLYIAMTVILWVASLSHQFAMWIAVEQRVTHNREEEEKKEEEKKKRDLALMWIAVEKRVTHNREVDEKTEEEKKKTPEPTEEYKDPLKKLKELLNLGLDWQWQPITTQAAILFSLWAYLTFVDGNDISGTILGFIVQAASPWSLLYSCRVGFKTMPFLIKQLARVERVRFALCKCCCGSGQAPANTQAPADTQAPANTQAPADRQAAADRQASADRQAAAKRQAAADRQDAAKRQAAADRQENGESPFISHFYGQSDHLQYSQQSQL